MVSRFSKRRDVARCSAADILIEDPADRFCLVFDDLPFARPTGRSGMAVDKPACSWASADAHRHGLKAMQRRGGHIPAIANFLFSRLRFNSGNPSKQKSLRQIGAPSAASADLFNPQSHQASIGALRRRGHYRIAQRADAVDRQVADVANLHLADAFRRTGHDEIARQQRHDAGEVADHHFNRKYHVAGV
jgi:hypothetical protein